jgi:tripartite-type tricarboxylate transporter receptor subunit TctC
MLNRRKFIAGTGAAAAAATLAAPSVRAQGAWPNRPVTVIVPWGAGGGTDYHARTAAALLEKEFKQPFNVVQRTGGSGVVGHSAIAEAAADGYTIGMVTVEIGMMHWQGLTKLTHANYTPISLVQLVPAGLQVAADSKWKTAKELIDDIKANPGKIKSSGTGQGGIWHIAIAGLLQSMKIPPSACPWVPSEGAASGLADMVAGGVQVVPCAVAEAATLIKAGKVRGLATMTPARLPGFPDIPTVKEALASDWTCVSFVSIMGPKGMPAEAAAKLDGAIAKIVKTDDWKKAMDARGFGHNYMNAADLGTFAAKTDAEFGAVMKAIGLAKG